MHAELAVAVERERADVALGQAVAADQLVRGGADLVDRVRQLHVEQLGRVVEPLQVLLEPEDGRAVRGLVAADALEDTRAVVEPVHADVDLRVGPVDELAVHPDRLCLAHQASPLGPESYVGVLDGVHRLRACEPNEDAGVQGRHVRRGACADPDGVVSEQVLVDQDAIDIRAAGRARPRRARSPVPPRPRRPRAMRASIAPAALRDLREVDATVAGHEHDDGTAVAEDDDRLDDLAERAAGGARGVLGGRGARFELFESRLRTCGPQKCGDPFDGLGPAQAHVERVPVSAQPNAAARSVVFSTASAETLKAEEGEKIARTESLFREVNERIAESAERFDADETKFVCECADPTCTHRVEATLEEYERVREDGATFLSSTGTRTSGSKRSCGQTASAPSSRSGTRSWRRLARRLNPRATYDDSPGRGAGSPRSRGSARARWRSSTPP